MKPFVPVALALAIIGCNSSTPSARDPARKITWAEYQRMDAEQKDDPYVLDNLDDGARKKLAESQRQKKRR